MRAINLEGKSRTDIIDFDNKPHACIPLKNKSCINQDFGEVGLNYSDKITPKSIFTEISHDISKQGITVNKRLS